MPDPSTPITQEESDQEYYRSLYMDEEKRKELFETPNWKATEQYIAPGDLDEFRSSVINSAYLKNQTGQNMTDATYPVIRDAYAQEAFGMPLTTEKEFADKVRGQFETADKRRLAASELYSNSVLQTLDDELKGSPKSSVDKFAKWQEKYQDVFTADEMLEMFVSNRGVVQQAKEGIKGIAPQAARVWDSLTKYNEGEASETDVRSIGTELAAMRHEDRQKLYRYVRVAAQAQGDDGGRILSAANNLQKSLERGFADYVPFGPGVETPEQKIARLSPRPMWQIELGAGATMTRLSRDEDTRSSPAKQEEFARAQQTLEMVQVVRELKDLAATGIDPIKPIFPEGKFLSLGTAERGIYGAAGSLGYMFATAVNPTLGAVGLYNAERDSMLLDNPQMDRHAAGAAALVSSVFQTGIEMLQIRGLSGLSSPILGVMRSMKGGVLRTAGAIVAGTAEQNIEESIQDAASVGIPYVMSHFRDDMPDQNGTKLMQGYVKQRAEVFWSMLPFGIIGGGAASFRDFKNEQKNDRALTYAGFSDEQRQRILTARDPDAQFRIEISKRDKVNIEDGINQLQADFQRAQSLQDDAELPTLESSVLPDGTREWRVMRNPPSETAGIQYLTPEEMKGKTVSLPTVNTATGQVTQIQFTAEAGQAKVKRNIEAYSQLVDCLLR